MKIDKITILDIAKEINVSTISISRALSGQTGVSDELRNKIIDKAKEMGYLKTKNNSDINILVLHRSPFLQDSSNHSHMIQGIQEAIQTLGCGYDLELADKERQEKLYLPNKIEKNINYDGLVFIGRFDVKYFDFIAKKIRNQVSFAGYSPSFECDSVWYNFNNSGYKQCEYLIKMGHKKIGFLGNQNSYVNKEKSLGISLALEDHNLEVKDDFFVDDEDLEINVFKLIEQISIPTAMICQSDYIAIKFVKLLLKEGIKVPEDISIIGSGNTEMASLSIPSLTTLDLNIDYACETAVSLLLKRISNPNKPYESVFINSTLIERESVKKIGD